MKNNIIICIGALAFLTVASQSCNKMESDSTPIINEGEKVETFTQSNAILSFESENDFLAAVQAVRRGNNDVLAETRSASPEHFISLYEEFVQAMSEADYYYQREGGYEEFKERFPNLYYPEYAEDYAAFLPVSDEIVAQFINQDGKVIIAGKEKDLRDVWTYEKIQELGLAMPEEDVVELPETRASSSAFRLTLDKQDVNKKRRAWITRRGITIDDMKFGRLDLCFRKKGLLGWYNGTMTSNSYIIERMPGFGSTIERKIWYNGGGKLEEYSPHKYYVACRPASDESSSYGVRDFYFECDSDPTYNFTAYYTADVDALLDLNNGTGFWEDVAAFFSGKSATIGFQYHF